MSIIGTYCQICALPIQHTHYIPTEVAHYFEIAPNPGIQSLVDFGSQHDWLLKGVALPCQEESADKIVKGLIDEGAIKDTSIFVGDGVDSFAAVHEMCWEMAGGPTSYEAIRYARYTHEWVVMNRYQKQLFDIKSLLEDQKAWMLEEGDKTKTRIKAILKSAETNLAAYRRLPFESVDQALSTDFWRHSSTGVFPQRGFWRYRLGILPGTNKGSFTSFIQSDHSFTPDTEGLPFGSELAKLEAYEKSLISSLEKSKKAILVLSLVNRGNMHFILYTPDEDACVKEMKEISRQCTGTEAFVGTESDPNWNILYSEFFTDQNLLHF